MLVGTDHNSESPNCLVIASAWLMMITLGVGRQISRVEGATTAADPMVVVYFVRVVVSLVCGAFLRVSDSHVTTYVDAGIKNRTGRAVRN